MNLTGASPELHYTVLTALFTAMLWIPIIANRLFEMGVWMALRNPQPDLRPDAAWAFRLANAHRNALENLAVFAPLAVAVDALGTGTSATALWAAIFFISRIAHAVIYAFGVPVLRTLAFLAGFLAQLVLALNLIGNWPA